MDRNRLRCCSLRTEEGIRNRNHTNYYLFLSKPTPRILVCTDARNMAAIKAAEKAGFRKEGLIRNGGFTNGKLADTCLLGILREEWKEPKILTKTA